MRYITLALLLIIGIYCGAHVAAQETSAVRFSVKSFAVEGENPLSDPETRAVLDLYLGEHDGVDGLKAAAAALNRRFAEKGFPTRRAIVPAQTLSNGVARSASQSMEPPSDRSPSLPSKGVPDSAKDGVETMNNARSRRER